MTTSWPERALSIRQPWADLILFGTKDVENRTRPFPSTVDLPARIGVHASKQTDTTARARLAWIALRNARGIPITAGTLGALDRGRLGALLGHVTVTGSHYTDACWTPTGMCSPWAEDGDAWHWTLTDPEPLPEPIPMPGALGLWRLTHHSD